MELWWKWSINSHNPMISNYPCHREFTMLHTEVELYWIYGGNGPPITMAQCIQ
jgi:hypothetical protein